MSESQRILLVHAVTRTLCELSNSVHRHGMPRDVTKGTFRELFEAATSAGLDMEEYRVDYNQFDPSTGWEN